MRTKEQGRYLTLNEHNDDDDDDNDELKIKNYQKKWLQHVQRMDTYRLPRQALEYRPEGKRNFGRPKKKWRDQIHFED